MLLENNGVLRNSDGLVLKKQRSASQKRRNPAQKKRVGGLGGLEGLGPGCCLDWRGSKGGGGCGWGAEGAWGALGRLEGLGGLGCQGGLGVWRAYFFFLHIYIYI